MPITRRIYKFGNLIADFSPSGSAKFAAYTVSVIEVPAGGADIDLSTPANA